MRTFEFIIYLALIYFVFFLVNFAGRNIPQVLTNYYLPKGLDIESISLILIYIIVTIVALFKFDNDRVILFR